MTCVFPEMLSLALGEYIQAALCGVAQGVGGLPGDIQKLVEWVGISYTGHTPLPLSGDGFMLEVKLGFEVCDRAVQSSAATKVDVYGCKDLASRVKVELRALVFLMIERHVRLVNQAALKSAQLLV